MRKIWHDDAWDDYLYWQTQDKKTLKKINKLLKDIDRNGYKFKGCYDLGMGYLISETTKEEREKIVGGSLGNINGSCDGCMAGLAEMYQDYIDGKK